MGNSQLCWYPGYCRSAIMYVRAQSSEKTQLVKAKKYMNSKQTLAGSFCTQHARDSHDTSECLSKLSFFFLFCSVQYQFSAPG